MRDLRSGRLVDELDAYFDAAPRSDAVAVDTGAFTLFVGRRSPSGYYARPALGHTEPITSADVDHLAEACVEHRVDLAIEWIDEIHPELADIAAAYELEVGTHALMVAASGEVAAASALDADVRIIDSDDPAIASVRAVADVAFIYGGTQAGPGGPVERDVVARGLSADFVEHLRDRHRRGLTVTAVAESESGVLAVGSYQPIGDWAEVLAVATLPEARRRGLAAAIVAELAGHAAEHRVGNLLLSAQDEDVARIYRRVGFRRVGSTHAADRI
jgi:GNAT superfamily N-acetyltransferase